MDLQRLIESERAEDDILYSVVDAARDTRLALACRKLLNEPARPLLERAGVHMKNVGPYLTPVRPGGRYGAYLDLYALGFGKSCGILLLSEAWPQAMREHLRSVMRVEDERGAEFFFRFYDPRVLRAFLPTCTGSEAKQFFGPIRRMLVEADTPNVMLICERTSGGARVLERPISSRQGGSEEG